MLGKLLKYEYKDTSRIIPFFYLIIFIFITTLFISKGFNTKWLTTTSSLLIIVASIITIILTFVIIALRFHHNLYTNEGYLMFTLPLRPQLLLASKLIAAFTWIIVSIMVSIGAIIVSLYGFGVSGREVSLAMEQLKELGLDKIIYLIIPLVLLEIIYFIAQVFFAITVSNIHIFHKMGNGGPFVIFIAVSIISKILISLAAIAIPLSISYDMINKEGIKISSSNMIGTIVNAAQPKNLVIGLGGYIFEFIMTCVLIYLTGLIMSKKVSLK